MVTEYTEGITVVIPSIPPRADRLEQALNSVRSQTLQPVDVIVSIDTKKLGAPKNRDNGLFQVKTEWTAFLDDDDFFYPTHLEDLHRHALETGADMVYPWFDVHGGTDPIPAFEGQPWDDNQPHVIPITTLVRTEVAHKVNGFSGAYGDGAVDPTADQGGEDWLFTLKLIAGGYKISHLNKRTWGWNHWGYGTPDNPGNTSGRSDRW